MKPLPTSVLKLLAMLPDDHPHRITLHTDGHGQWDVEVYSRYSFEAGASQAPPLPLREQAVKHPPRPKNTI